MSLNSVLTPTGKTPGMGGVGYESLKDYQHAARIFTDDNFRLSPKYDFLFYVEFDFNPLITNVSSRAAQELGMIVKTVSLPKYTIEHKVHNAYNRVNITQHKIKYDPVQITFHDDQADNVRNFWYDYYSFFFRDSDYADATYQGISKYQSRPTFDWGYSPRPTVGYNQSQLYQPYQYIQGIRIYSLYQKNFSEYQLVNPTITSFGHGEHRNGQNGLVEHSMSIQFETVKYLTGYVTPNTVGGFIDLHYDSKPSPITPAGGADLVDNGAGGVVHASDTVVDLAYANPLTQLGFINSYQVQVNNLGLSGQKAAGSYNSSTLLSSSSGTGGAGFSIPTLGSLSQGATGSALLSQQLNSAAAALAGTVVSNAANGVIGAVAKGLGPQGTAIVGGIAQAIINPKAALAAVENMAINWAVQKASQAVVNFTQPYIDGAAKNITEFTSKAWADTSGWFSQQAASIGTPLTTQAIPGFGNGYQLVLPESATGVVGGGTAILDQTTGFYTDSLGNQFTAGGSAIFDF